LSLLMHTAPFGSPVPFWQHWVVAVHDPPAGAQPDDEPDDEPEQSAAAAHTP
jgi:hypothetical protein